MLLPHCCHFIENFILTKVIKNIYKEQSVCSEIYDCSHVIGQQVLTVIN